MKKGFRERAICLVICALMTVSLLAACGSSGGGDTVTTTTAATAAQTQGQAEAADQENAATGQEADATTAASAQAAANEERITISWTLTDTYYPGDFNGEMAEFFKNKFNVELNFNVVDFINWEEKVTVLMSSGDITDLVYLAISSTNFNRITSWAQSGILRPMPDDFSAYPSMKAIRDKFDDYYKTIKIDDKDFCWLVPRNNLSECTPSGVLYRYDWARDVGMMDENHTYTYVEFTDLIKKVVDEDPGGVGNNLIGYGDTTWAQGFYAYALDCHPYWESFVLNPDTGLYEWTFHTQGMYDKFKLMNDLFKEGYYWQDFYSGGDEVLNGHVMTGDIFARHFYSTPLALQRLKDGFLEAFPDKNFLDCYTFAWVTGLDGKVYSIFDELYYACQMYSAKVDEAKFQKILEIQDWMASDDGQNTCSYGFQGRDWDYNADGSLNITWPKDENGQPVSPAEELTKILNFSCENRKRVYFTGQYDEDITQFDYESQLAKIDMYNAGTFLGLEAPDMMESNFYIGPVKLEYGDLSGYTFPYRSNLIAADNYDAVWQALIDEYGSVATAIEDELNDALIRNR